MPLVIAFVELLGAALLITSAIADASFRDVVSGKAEADYKAAQASSSSSTTGSSTGSSAGSGSGTTSGSTSLPGGSNPQKIFNFFTSHGFTPVAAAGFVGNFTQESSDNPGEAGGGLAQWIGSRWTNLVNYAASIGQPTNSLETQLQFVLQELHGYPGLVNQVNSASTPQQAADLISQQYERPGIPDLANRENYAAAAYNSYATN